MAVVDGGHRMDFHDGFDEGSMTRMAAMAARGVGVVEDGDASRGGGKGIVGMGMLWVCGFLLVVMAVMAGMAGRGREVMGEGGGGGGGAKGFVGVRGSTETLPVYTAAVKEGDSRVRFEDNGVEEWLAVPPPAYLGVVAEVGGLKI